MFYKTLQILWNSRSSIPWLPFHLRYFQQFLPLRFFLPICSRSVPLHPQNLLVTCHFPTLRKPQALPTSPWHSLTPKLSLYLFHFLFHCPLQRFPLHQGMNPSQAVPASRGPLKEEAESLDREVMTAGGGGPASAHEWRPSGALSHWLGLNSALPLTCYDQWT